MPQRSASQMVFYVGVPVVIGLVLGFDQAGVGIHFPWYTSVLFWVMTSLTTWAMFHLGSLLAAVILRPWTESIVAIVTCGMLMASIPTRSLISTYVFLLEPMMLGGRTARPLPPISADLAFLAGYLRTWGGVFVLWMAANLWLAPLLGLRPYAAASRASAGDEFVTASDGLQLPLFFERVVPSVRGKLIALKAEDHYLRVFTDQGEDLILYRLSDAIAELAALGFPGIRTHRSWWASKAFVLSAHLAGAKPTLNMRAGPTIPVSMTYRESVRLAMQNDVPSAVSSDSLYPVTKTQAAM